MCASSFLHFNLHSLLEVKMKDWGGGYATNCYRANVDREGGIKATYSINDVSIYVIAIKLFNRSKNMFLTIGESFVQSTNVCIYVRFYAKSKYTYFSFWFLRHCRMVRSEINYIFVDLKISSSLHYVNMWWCIIIYNLKYANKPITCFLFNVIE